MPSPFTLRYLYFTPLLILQKNNLKASLNDSSLKPPKKKL